MTEKSLSKILIVDDCRENLRIIMSILEDEYIVVAATNGKKALTLAVQEPVPDLVLLDIIMPGLDGYEVCRRLKNDSRTESTPVIFTTALKEDGEELKGLELGAVDYITKPYVPDLVKARVKNHLELQQHRNSLEAMVAERTRDLKLTQSIFIDSLGALAEYRDPETGGHIKRTQNYVKALALELSKSPDYRDQLSDEVIDLLHKSAPLHDIGKVGIADKILLKPGQLSDIEFEEMKRHAEFGYKTIKESMQKLHSKSFLKHAMDIAYTHHEKWDGSGYPRGLKGDNIPLSGRLMALADVYDALISKRCYKPPFTHEKAVAIIKDGKGSHFDPTIVDIFLNIESTFLNIAVMYADCEEVRKMNRKEQDKILAPRIKNNKKVLLVDDDEINLEVMKNQLESIGYSVDVASDGSTALSVLKTASFDLIMTDLDMPDLTGCEMVRIVRAQGSIVPIFAVTSSMYDMTREQLLDRGFDDYLLKPFDAGTLIKKISSNDNYSRHLGGDGYVGSTTESE